MTIRRRTQAFETALAASRPGNVWCFSLENGFRGERIDSFVRWTPRSVLEKFSFAKLSEDGGKYTLHVHSNLWYEWPKSGAMMA